MSASMVYWAWTVKTPSSASKLVLLYLAQCQHPTQSCCSPSTAQIVEHTGLDKKTVPKAVGQLVECDLLEVKSRPGFPSVYRLLCNEGEGGEHVRSE